MPLIWPVRVMPSQSMTPAGLPERARPQACDVLFAFALTARQYLSLPNGTNEVTWAAEAAEDGLEAGGERDATGRALLDESTKSRRTSASLSGLGSAVAAGVFGGARAGACRMHCPTACRMHVPWRHLASRHAACMCRGSIPAPRGMPHACAVAAPLRRAACCMHCRDSTLQCGMLNESTWQHPCASA
jgi:hypothetical protein